MKDNVELLGFKDTGQNRVLRGHWEDVWILEGQYSFRESEPLTGDNGILVLS